MILSSKNSSISLSKDTGSVLSYKIKGKEFCAPGGEMRPLFTIKFLDKEGNYIYHNSLEAEKVAFAVSNDGIVISFENIAGLKLSAAVNIKMAVNDTCHWNIAIDNNTKDIMEWVEFPQISVPDSLKGEGGEFELFWPVVEGMIIDDKNIRDMYWVKYREIGGQMSCWDGFYPRSCPMQFMAYYNDDCGLYFAAHDKNSNPKTVEWRAEPDGIALEYRLFTNGVVGHFETGFDMVTAPFHGDWTDACEIYRNWSEKEMARPKKLHVRNDLPNWIADAPVVAIYPIKGSHDQSDMSTNMYYPYANMLPIAKDYSEKMASKVMALPMHWEGTAPWATPYVWPPFGGEDEFKNFVDEIHKQGNLIGVYCSGIGWTTYSYLNPECDFSDRYDETLMCRTPKGTIEQSKTIGPPIREGYDMCPVSPKVAEIVSDEVCKIASSGVDYAQYFDQNLGGNASFCYARDHGHPPAPGKWMNDAMMRIFDKTLDDLKSMNSNLVLGCESAAAEPFIEKLPINDLRFNVAFYFGKPVPAYSYVFHEYINNFMGNQITTYVTMDLEKNPHCLLFRLAYSFAAGDMLTLTLGKEGKISWGWGVPWDTDYPDQANALTLIKNINHWRIDKKEFLHYGKMIKAKPFDKVGEFVIYRKNGTKVTYPSLLTTRWVSPDGREEQIVVNFLPEVQSFAVDGIKYEIEPLSALWID